MADKLTLQQARVLFTRLLPRLVDRAFELGFEVACGEVVRGAQQAAWNAKQGKGIKNSLHTRGLAVDLILYRDGIFQTQTPQYRDLGEWWERQHALARWGGRFGDGNHFSIEFEGVK